MAITNYERVGKALELLREGLAPFVEREFKNKYSGRMLAEANRFLGGDVANSEKSFNDYDAAALLRLMWDGWNDIFRNTLGFSDRSLVSELREIRNKWAHQQPFSTDDAYRALDSASRLLAAVSAPQATELDKIKQELLRVSFEEKVRSEKRRQAENVVESQVNSTVKAWREIINPHKDVSGGNFKSAEFAADLLQVYIGEADDEYGKPVEFFRRTFITESLKTLLVNAVERLSDRGGDPVVQLQTNFGGGKTHSMLALYHLFSGTKPQQLEGIEEILKKANIEQLPKVKRAVLVGNRMSPGNPQTKDDGTVVRTLWGELAWQLGGREAYDLIRADDEQATSPGDRLRDIFNKYGPCLILIDEWVAYARQLHEDSDLPAGSFETQFSFAQALTESAKLARGCLLVISLPASDTTGSPHAQADDAEVGGRRGREALERLRNVVGRLEASWRPASAEEGFEIVRRRLFEPLLTQAQFVARDGVARAFYDQYRTQEAEFPTESRTVEYEQRLKAAYPIHPEVFDRLYGDWSTVPKFQRTRGVLRLMAHVIHRLWESGDHSPLIMPASIPINDPVVQSELTRYLSDNWVPIIEKDVDGPNSLPYKLDSELPNLGRLSATRRVARTIFLGSAPITSGAHTGLEDKRVKLGCTMPGESPAIFGDALRRLGAAATYLYQDGVRSWYSTQPTVIKVAADRAEELIHRPEEIKQEINKRVKDDTRNRGDFRGVHVDPASSQEIPDERSTRLVVLGIANPYTNKEPGSEAEKFARVIVETRGTGQRYYRNTLVFLAVDKIRLQELDESVRTYLAWESIVADKDKLNLTGAQIKQAEKQRSDANDTLDTQIPEAYQWLIVPMQTTPSGAIEYKAFRLFGRDALAVRAAKKLRKEDLLATSYAASRLKMDLDNIPLWRGQNHIEITQLVEDYAQYLYLSRLCDPGVLYDAVRHGLGILTWREDSFAYADSFDDSAGRYRGLICGQQVAVSESHDDGILVKPEVAEKQVQLEVGGGPLTKPGDGEDESPPGETGGILIPPPADVGQSKPKAPKRYYGSVKLDPTRAGRDASRIAEEVIAHLSGIMGADVKVTLEIEAYIPNGAPEQVVRIVTENGQTLKFTNQGFEKE